MITGVEFPHAHVLAPKLEGEVRAVRVVPRASKGTALRVFGWLRHAESRIASAWLSVDESPPVELTLETLAGGGCALHQEMPLSPEAVGELPVLVVDLENGQSIVVDLPPQDRVVAPHGRFRHEVSVPGHHFPSWPTGRASESSNPKKICIATTDFVGPIKNGGMGTCYTNMAQLLAAHGHDVTVLYDQSEYCEHETIEFWIEHYAKQNIKFVPLPPYTGRTTATWVRDRSYAIYRWLEERDFDWIHFHEMVGGGFYTTLAASLGIAFHETSICVGLHSPTRWHLHYNHTLPNWVDQLEVEHMERVTAECADVLFSPSHYLLGWCWKDGWALPINRVVIPYPLFIDEPPRARHGHRTVDEVVFFGRLESRKGLRLFCDAVDMLVARGVVPKSISFLGKEKSEEGLASSTYIEKRARKWGSETKILSSFGRSEALEYLRAPGKLAVIASLTDNSPYTIYECLGYGIPFLASSVGGIPELVSEESRERVLFDLQGAALADKLEQALKEGVEPTRAVSSITQLNERWLEFHRCAPVSVHAPRRKVKLGGKPLAVLFMPCGSSESREGELIRMKEQIRALAETVELLVPNLNSSTGGYNEDEIARMLRACSARFVLPCFRAIVFDPSGVRNFLDALETSDADIVSPVLHIGDPMDNDNLARTTVLPLGGAPVIDMFKEFTGGALVAVRREVLLPQKQLKIEDLGRTSRLLSRAMENSLLIVPVAEVLGTVFPNPEHDCSRDEFDSSVERLDSMRFRGSPLWIREFLQYSVGLFNRARLHHLQEPTPSALSNRLPELFVASEDVVVRADRASGFGSLEPFQGVLELFTQETLSFRSGEKPTQFLLRDPMLSGSGSFVAKMTVVAQHPATIKMRYLGNSETVFSGQGESIMAVPQGRRTVYSLFETKRCQGFVSLSIEMQPGSFEIVDFELRRCALPGFGDPCKSLVRSRHRIVPQAAHKVNRFVILFEGRTASTYIAEWLDSLPPARCFPESLQRFSREGQIWWMRRVFSAEQPGLQAIGFKTKLRDVKDPVLFRRALQDFGCRVVYMTRRNLIKATLSTINAERRFAATGEWNRLPSMSPLGPLEVSVERLNDYLGLRLDKEAALSEFVAKLDCPVMKVDYEELLIDADHACNRICDFLGISSRNGSSRWLKETDDDLRRALVNYEELKQHYKGTPYEDMF